MCCADLVECVFVSRGLFLTCVLHVSRHMFAITVSCSAPLAVLSVSIQPVADVAVMR
jgi:hypothetical protein